jgi:uncharacterized protein (TIGR02246 family)
MRPLTAICAVVLLTAGCGPATPAVDAAAEERAIRALDDQWNAAIAKKDVDANVAFYAADGVAMWPDAQAAKGTDAIRTAWTEMLKTPNLKLVLTPQEVTIAQAGDVATDVGQVRAEMDTPQGGHVMETAKYLVVWKKMNGAWKVHYDIFNGNSPPPPPTAPVTTKK